MGRDMRPRRRLSIVLSTVLGTLWVTAGHALAGNIDGGQGTIGETNDKIVTLFGFAVIVGIPTFALIMSLGQWRLDKRKDKRLAAAKARTATRDKRLGW